LLNETDILTPWNEIIHCFCLLSSAARGSYLVLIVAEYLSVHAKKMLFYVKLKKSTHSHSASDLFWNHSSLLYELAIALVFLSTRFPTLFIVCGISGFKTVVLLRRRDV